MAYINGLGGKTPRCNAVARQIWLWCQKHNNWLTATHLPGLLNTHADLESRSIHDNTEWKLNTILFDKICQKWGKPEIDLFASRLNCQLDEFMSWKPDPSAKAMIGQI